MAKHLFLLIGVVAASAAPRLGGRGWMAPAHRALGVARGGATETPSDAADAEASEEPRVSPNLLHASVDDDAERDPTVVEISAEAMDALGVVKGDTVRLTGKQRRRTLAIVKAAPAGAAPHDAVVSKALARNLRLRDFGGDVTLHTADAKHGAEVTLSPVLDEEEDDESDDGDDEAADGDAKAAAALDPETLFDDFVAPYFKGGFRPVHVGDVISIQSASDPDVSRDFVVSRVVVAPDGAVADADADAEDDDADAAGAGEEAQMCIVVPQTEIEVADAPVARDEVEPDSSVLTYVDDA